MIALGQAFGGKGSSNVQSSTSAARTPEELAAELGSLLGT